MAKPLYVQVTANPRDDFPYRFRAGRAWSRSPVVVEVIDGGAPGPQQITRAQLEALRSDKRISVVLGVDAPPPPPKTPEQTLASLQEQIAELQRQMGDLKAAKK